VLGVARCHGSAWRARGPAAVNSTASMDALQVPSTWRPVVEDPATLQLFLDFYATTKPPLSSMALECLVRPPPRGPAWACRAMPVSAAGACAHAAACLCGSAPGRSAACRVEAGAGHALTCSRCLRRGRAAPCGRPPVP